MSKIKTFRENFSQMSETCQKHTKIITKILRYKFWNRQKHPKMLKVSEKKFLMGQENP